MIKNVLIPLAKSVLIILGLTAAVPAADAHVNKKILGSGTTTLIITNSSTKSITQRIQYQKKNRRTEFSVCRWEHSAASLWGDMLP